MNNGWISIHRKIFDNPYWLSEPFTRGQAWIDLLLLANHTKGFFRLRNGKKINVKRGQCAWSEEALAERWRWSRGKIKRFKNELENEQQIVQEKSMNLGLITIINYNKYQTDSTRDSTRDGQETDINNKDNKNNKKILHAKAGKIMKNYQESKHSDFGEPVIDADTGERVADTPKTDTQRKMKDLLQWAEKRRGSKFITPLKQYSAFSLAKKNGSK